jgi:glutamate formiminotransferase/formiminotetrahydrofolate cyclodeaminase
MYLNKPLRDFLDDTSSRTPTPGGGSVSALTGALGAALLCMVANFTLGKKKYKEVEEDVKEILKEAEDIKEKLTLLIQQDIESYQRLSQAMRISRGDSLKEEDQAKILEKSLKEASEVPLGVAQLSFQLIKLGQRLLSRGNPNLITDTGIGVLLGEAALQSAALNVEINLISIKDEKFREDKRRTLSSLLSQGKRIKDEVLRKIKQGLKEDSR